MDRARVAEWLEQLGRLPPGARMYDLTARDAASEFGLDAATLHDLMDAGLVHLSVDGEPRFAFTDLHYLGLRLGTAHGYLAAIAFWARSLADFAGRPRTGVRIRYLTRGGACEQAVVRLPGLRDAAMTLEPHRAAIDVEAEIPGDCPLVDDRVLDAVAELSAMEFCVLPPALRGDVELARATGLAECRTMTALLLEACRELEVPARPAHGLLVSIPLSTSHTWAEVRGDGAWLPVDPLLVRLLTDFGGLDPAAWPPHRSLGALLLRVCEQPGPLVARQRDGAPVATEFLTVAGET